MAEQNVALQPPQVEQPVEIDEDNLPLGQFITLSITPDRSSNLYPTFGQTNFQLKMDIILLF